MTITECLGGQVPEVLIRYGDTQNKLSIGTVAAYATGTLVREHAPYNREYAEDGTLTIIPTYHFIAELRRQLSGDIVVGTSGFSAAEEQFYKDYVEWVDGTTKYGEILVAVVVTDVWLTDEVSLLPHAAVNRDYEEWNPWMKLIEEDTTC